MRWPDFEKEKENFRKVWRKMKSEYTGEMRVFLDRSYLVIGYDFGQVSFDADAFGIGKENPGFLIDNREGQVYLRLIESYKLVEKDADASKRERSLEKIKEFDIEGLSVVAHRAEVRFPTVHMDYIQELKQSRYCDRERTGMSRASIRVILKTN